MEKTSNITELLHRLKQKQSIASLTGLDAVAQSQDAPLLMMAHQMMLDIPGAYYWAQETGQTQSLADVAKWYGRYPDVVKALSTKKEYQEYLCNQALAHFGLFRSEDKQDYSVDTRAYEQIVRDLAQNGYNPQQILRTMILRMEKQSHNIVQRLFLAQQSGEKGLIEPAEQEYVKRGTWRQGLDAHVAQWAAAQGLRTKLMQRGDHDPYFPIASNVYVLGNEEPIAVVKERLPLYVDFDRLDGYNQEQDILQIIDHDNIVGLEDVVEIEGNTLLQFPFVQGVSPLEVNDIREKLSMAYELALTVSYLHDNNIVYLDMKPKNIIYDGHVHLLDFGMAQIGNHVRTLPSTPGDRKSVV